MRDRAESVLRVKFLEPTELEAHNGRQKRGHNSYAMRDFY